MELRYFEAVARSSHSLPRRRKLRPAFLPASSLSAAWQSAAPVRPESFAAEAWNRDADIARGRINRVHHSADPTFLPILANLLAHCLHRRTRNQDDFQGVQRLAIFRRVAPNPDRVTRLEFL